MDRIISHVPENSRILDIGCGSGLVLGLLAGLHFNIRGTGFDRSEAGIDMAQRMQRRIPPSSPTRISFQHLSIDDPWPLGTFDVVLMIDVIHHVPPLEQRSVVEKAISVLAPGGKLIYKDMCSGPWWRAQANRLHDLVVAKEYVHYVPVEALKAWAAQSNMRVICEESYHRLWYGHELLVMTRQPGEK